MNWQAKSPQKQKSRKLKTSPRNPAFPAKFFSSLISDLVAQPEITPATTDNTRNTFTMTFITRYVSALHFLQSREFIVLSPKVPHFEDKLHKTPTLSSKEVFSEDKYIFLNIEKCTKTIFRTSHCYFFHRELRLKRYSHFSMHHC